MGERWGGEGGGGFQPPSRPFSSLMTGEVSVIVTRIFGSVPDVRMIAASSAQPLTSYFSGVTTLKKHQGRYSRRESSPKSCRRGAGLPSWSPALIEAAITERGPAPLLTQHFPTFSPLSDNISIIVWFPASIWPKGI